MKKNLLLFLLTFSSVTANPQTYPIPGATQQPAWVFPFFIEDAHGNKDTLYVGYDSFASQCFCAGDDPGFGENWFVTDTDNFYVVTYLGSGHFPNDSAVRVNILPDLCPNNWCFTIGAINTYYPVKFSWDVSLLHSDSIPFPDQDPLPRAQINVVWYSGVNSIHTATCGSNPLVISDTVQASCSCQYRDSLIIYHFFNDTSKSDCGLSIQIGTWTGMNLVGLTENSSNDNIQIYPIPTDQFININAPMLDYKFEIIDLAGIVLKKGLLSNDIKKIYVGDISPGWYIIRMYNGSGIINRKIIIQH